MKTMKVNGKNYVVNDGKYLAQFKTAKECSYYCKNYDKFRTEKEMDEALANGLADRICGLADGFYDEYGYEFYFWSDLLECFRGCCPEITKIEGKGPELKKIYFGTKDGYGEFTFTSGSMYVKFWHFA